MGSLPQRTRRWAIWLIGLAALPGCHHTIPIAGRLQTDSQVQAGIHGAVTAGITGSVDVKVPMVSDPGPLIPIVVRGGSTGDRASRVAMIDVDGLLVNQSMSGLYSAGENPVSSFREKLEAAANDTRVKAVVIRLNSPGGGVAASDVMAEELRRFRQATGKPIVACMLDVATGGAYYIAVGCDRIVALPTSITGAVGAIVNHTNLQDAMSQLNLRVDTIKSAELVDMGSVTAPLPDEARELFAEMTKAFGDRFLSRVVRSRPRMTQDDLKVIRDGRILTAPKALDLHLIDGIGYPDDAILEAERIAGLSGSEVVLFQRKGYPVRSVYASVPNVPLQSELIPFSYPGLDRAKLPTFLYLWQPDPTLSKPTGR